MSLFVLQIQPALPSQGFPYVGSDARAALQQQFGRDDLPMRFIRTAIEPNDKF